MSIFSNLLINEKNLMIGILKNRNLLQQNQ